MKVRILGNTIRLRTKMHETSELYEHGMIKEVLSFGPSDEDQLIFRLVAGAEDYAIEHDGMDIRIILPKVKVVEWATTDLIGIEQIIRSNKGNDIRVLIEKDFACLDGEREFEEGSYPNPELSC